MNPNRRERICVNNIKTGTVSQTHKTTLMARKALTPFFGKIKWFERDQYDTLKTATSQASVTSSVAKFNSVTRLELSPLLKYRLSQCWQHVIVITKTQNVN